MDSVLIRNGRIVTATDDYRADILVEDGRVRMIGRDIPVGGNVSVHDASGLLVLPGEWTCTLTSIGISATPARSIRSEPGPARQPSAAPRPSWISPTRRVGRAYAPGSTTGTGGRRARAWTSPPT